MLTRSEGIQFAKGHGTGNDFVILPDADGRLDLSAELVRRICDRRTGIGADGVLRVLRCDAEPQAAQYAGKARWFMDYRNSDGSIAQMCGNGSRVFAKFLISCGWESRDFIMASRAGLHQVTSEFDDTITVDLGRPTPGPDGPAPIVRVGAGEWTGQAWWLPNPHAVVFVQDLGALGPLLEAPIVIAGQRFPDGQNTEFVLDLTKDTEQPRARMRVFERGVGQTQSCGTGACAVALSVRARHGIVGPGSVVVDVPGGQLRVMVGADGGVALNGPAVLVGHGALETSWLDLQVD